MSIIQKTRIKLLLLLLVYLIMLPTRAKAQDDPGSQLVTLINQLRESQELPPYQVSFILTNVAQVHANWCAENNISKHVGPRGRDPNERARASGYGAGYNAYVLENLAYGSLEYHTPEMVIARWQRDTDLRNALISPNYEHIGVGYVDGFGMAWYVMMVGWVDERKPADDASGALQAPPGEEGLFLGTTGLEGDDSGAIYHKVQTGQSAWTIALYYQIDLGDLLAMNDLPGDAILHPGDLLMIRPPLVPTSTILPTPQPPAALLQAAELSQASTPTQEPVPAEALETPDPADGADMDTGTTRLRLLLGIGGGLAVLMFLYNRLRPHR